MGGEWEMRGRAVGKGGKEGGRRGRPERRKQEGATRRQCGGYYLTQLSSRSVSCCSDDDDDVVVVVVTLTRARRTTCVVVVRAQSIRLHLMNHALGVLRPMAVLQLHLLVQHSSFPVESFFHGVLDHPLRVAELAEVVEVRVLAQLPSGHRQGPPIVLDSDLDEWAVRSKLGGRKLQRLAVLAARGEDDVAVPLEGLLGKLQRSAVLLNGSKHHRPVAAD